MTVFEDIIIDPKNTTIDCFRYSGKDTVPMQFTVVAQGDTPYYLKGAAETQLFQLLGLTLEGIVNLSWEQRAPIIKEAFNRPLVLKCADGYPYAVVTTDYTTVRHRTAWGWAQDVLNQNMLSAELAGTLSTERKLFARFRTYKDYTRDRYSTYNNGFYILNSVRGKGSLSIGHSIYIPDADVYLTGPRLGSISHIGGLDTIEDQFKTLFLSSFFSFSMPNWEVLKIQPQQCLIARLDDVVRKYRIAIKRKLQDDATLYQAIVMTAIIAQTAPAKTRLELESLAYQEAYAIHD